MAMDVETKLDQIIKNIEDLRSKKPDRFTLFMPALIAAAVSLAVAVATQLVTVYNADRENLREIADAQGAIIREVGQLSFAASELILKHRLLPLYGSEADANYLAFVEDIAEYRAVTLETVGDDQLDAASLPVLSAALESEEALPPTSTIQDQFYSKDRLTFSDELIAKYGTRPDDLASALISAILPPSDRRSYRINLYIALTLARIPGGWPSTSDPTQAVKGLENTSNYKSDSTFRRRVGEAIANMVTPPAVL